MKIPSPEIGNIEILYLLFLFSSIFIIIPGIILLKSQLQRASVLLFEIYSREIMDLKPNILLCCTGSVATLKVPQLVVQMGEWANVLVVATHASRHFLMASKDYNPECWDLFEDMGGLDLCLYDDHEWSSWDSLGDTVLHIELRRWADIVVVAPASADVMAKVANGISDNLVLCVLRAWDPIRPCVMCPAMNTLMLRHPSTDTHISLLRSYGWRFIDSEVKSLACGEAGKGALAAVDTIVESVKEILGEMPMRTISSAERMDEKLGASEAIFRVMEKLSSSCEEEDRGGEEETGGNFWSRRQHLVFASGVIFGFILCLSSLNRKTRYVT